MNYKSIADRVFDANRDKIRKYQGIGLDDSDAFEINKLYGAIKFFEVNYWPFMEKILRVHLEGNKRTPTNIPINKLMDKGQIIHPG